MIARASLFTDHKISGLPIRAKYRHFSTICEQRFDKSQTDPITSSLKWWSSRHGVATLYSCLGCFIRQFAISLHTFLCMTFHVIPRGNVGVKFPCTWQLFCSRDSGFRHISVIVYDIFACLTFSLVATKNKRGRGMMSVLQNQRLS